MKSLFVLLTVALFSATVPAQPAGNTRNSSTGVENRLVGAWKLVSLEEPDAGGLPHKADCDGQFVFTNDGKAAVQVMYRGAQSGSAYAHGGSAYAHGGYEASYGSYRIDSASIFTFHIDGALVRTLIGKDLKRVYEISGNRLTVTSTDPNEHWKVVWERY